MGDDKKGTERNRPIINPPGDISPSAPEYLRQCGFALEPSINRLIELAVEAGWSRQDVLAAILIETGRRLETDKDGTRNQDGTSDDEQRRGRGRRRGLH